MWIGLLRAGIDRGAMLEPRRWATPRGRLGIIAYCTHAWVWSLPALMGQELRFGRVRVVLSVRWRVMRIGAAVAGITGRAVQALGVYANREIMVLWQGRSDAPYVTLYRESGPAGPGGGSEHRPGGGPGNLS